MNKLQELKELYYKELEYRDHISDKMTASITFFTVLCTSHMFIWSKMVELNFIISLFPLLFLTSEIACVFTTGISFKYFMNTYYKNIYALFPVEEVIDRVCENEKNKIGHTEAEINEANEQMIIDTLIECIKKNRIVNQSRLKCQLKMNRFLLISFLGLIFVYSLWIFVINIFTF